MATLIIPVRGDSYPAFDVDVTLGTDLYNISFRWNERDEKWYMALSDSDGLPIIAGIKIVTGWDLLRRVVDNRRPPGQIFAIDATTSDQDPGLDELGRRITLVYMDD